MTEQLTDALASDRIHKKAAKFAAYFQPGTNTHAPVDVLRAAWDSVRPFPEVVALCVGTRPDCVPDPVLDLLASYQDQFEVWLELGLQSARDRTLERLGRGHRSSDFTDACRRAQARGLLLCAHVILGLPGETAEDENYTATFLRQSAADGLKLHQLAIVKGTRLEEEWERGCVPVLAERDYVDRAAAFIGRLAPGTVLHRLVGDTAGTSLIAPKFNKGRVVREIRERLGG